MVKIKIFKYIILGIVGTVAYISYKAINLYSKTRGKRLVQKCRDDERYAFKIAESLTFLYEKTDFREDIFRIKIPMLQDGLEVDDSQILFIKKLKPDYYLILTYYMDTDYNITVGGAMGDVNRVHQFNYKMIIDREKNFIKIYSEPYADRNDKNLREIFSRNLFKIVQEVN